MGPPQHACSDQVRLMSAVVHGQARTLLRRVAL